MALLVKFKPENYTQHMESWAKWRQQSSGTGGGRAVGYPTQSIGRLGFYRGGKENILRKHPYTARGRQSDARADRQYLPEGYDTEYTIDQAVKELWRYKPEIAAAVEAQFLGSWQQNRESKAAALGVTLATYKARTADGQTFIVGFMRGRVLKSVAA